MNELFTQELYLTIFLEISRADLEV